MATKPTRRGRELMWIDHLSLLPGDASVTTSFDAVNSGVGGGLAALVVHSSTTGEEAQGGGNKVVWTALEVPPHYSVVGLRICYELTNARSFPEQETTAYERQTGTNLITAIVDPLSRRTEFAYDGLGNLTSITRLAGTPNAVTTSYSYEPTFNQLTSITDPLNHITNYGYNSRGALTSIADPLNHTTTFVPNGPGQPTQITDPLNHTTTLSYLLGDLVSVTDPLGNTTSRFIDAAGRFGSITDPLGNRTTYQYNALNDLTKITDPGGGQTTLAYDGNGNITSLTDALNHATTYSYDSPDRPATRTDALNRQESYAYDANGNLTSFTDRKSQVTTFQYDGLNRRTFVGFGTTGTPPNQTYTSTINYSYDAGNRLTQAVDSPTGTIADSYDGLDRLTQETEPNGTVSHSYDTASRRTGMTVAGQTPVSYSYDNADRLSTITQGTASVAIAYDNADRRTSITLPDGVAEQYSYDNANRRTSISYKLGASTLGDLNYDYAPDADRTAAWGSYARTGLPTAVSSFTYDAANELTQLGGTSASSDANGSLTSDGTSTYVWNNRGQLASLSGATAASFTYDAFGRRISKNVNATTANFFYDGPNVVQELSGSTPTANLLTGLSIDETFSRSDGSGTSSLLTDVLGSTVALANAAGTVTTSYTYEPFGNVTASGSSSTNSFQYTGRENDGTGLDYYRARYYSPTLQRFLSEDPLGFASGDVNTYAYVNDAPTTLVDPRGLCSSDSSLRSMAGRCDGFDLANLLAAFEKYFAGPAASVGFGAGGVGIGAECALWTAPISPIAGPIACVFAGSTVSLVGVLFGYVSYSQLRGRP